MFGSVSLPALGAEDWTRLQGRDNKEKTLNRKGTVDGEGMEVKGRVDGTQGAVDKVGRSVDRVLATALISRTTASCLVSTASCAWLARGTRPSGCSDYLAQKQFINTA